MSRIKDRTPVPVRLGECQCDGTPHDGQDGRDDGDIIYLRPSLDFEGGLAAHVAIGEFKAHRDTQRIQRELGTLFVRHGMTGWNLLDAKGEEVPPNVDLLDWSDLEPVAEKADELYAAAVFRPLVPAPSTSSRNGRTAPSTSATRSTSGRPRKR